MADSQGRLVFAPASSTTGWPYSTFTFLANDGETDSTSATVTVNLIPLLGIQVRGLSGGGDRSFSLGFNGETNATYRVWASTNLNTWTTLGDASQSPPGVFNFTDFAATNWPQRFYRVTCP